MKKKESQKKDKKPVIRDPFEEYSDIGEKAKDPYDFTYIGNYEDNVPEDRLDTHPEKDTFIPIKPYGKDFLKKGTTVLGRERKTYSLHAELSLRIKLLAARVTQDYRQSRRKKKCTESQLIEEGIRYILRKYKYKYKDIDGDDK